MPQDIQDSMSLPRESTWANLTSFSFRLQLLTQSSYPPIFHHAYAAYVCTMDAVPPGPPRLGRRPHRRSRSRLEVHLGARLSSSSDSRCHELL